MLGEVFRREQRGGHRWRFSEADGPLCNPDDCGQFINDENSQRRTTDQLAPARRTVHLHGGPTSFLSAVEHLGERLHPGVGQARRAGYKTLRNTFDDIWAGGLAIEDFTTALDQTPGEVLVGAFQVNHVAKAVIARGILRRIAPDLVRASADEGQ